MQTAASFGFTLTDDIVKYIPTKSSTHLLEKPTIVVIAYAEMKNIPFVYVHVLWVLICINIMFYVGRRCAFRNADTVISCSFSMFVSTLCIITHYALSVALHLPVFHNVCHALNYSSWSAYSDSLSDYGDLWCVLQHAGCFFIAVPSITTLSLESPYICWEIPWHPWCSRQC